MVSDSAWLMCGGTVTVNCAVYAAVVLWYFVFASKLVSLACLLNQFATERNSQPNEVRAAPPPALTLCWPRWRQTRNGCAGVLS